MKLSCALFTLKEDLCVIADELETGDEQEQQTAYAITLVAYAITEGKLAELQARLEPLAEKWLDDIEGEGVEEDGTLDAYRETVL